MRRRLANAGALAVSLGVLIGTGAAARAVWANGDLQHAMFHLAALRMRDAVIFWVLASVAVMLPTAVALAHFRPRTLVADRRWLALLAGVSALIAVLLPAGVALDARRSAPAALNVVLILVDALRADHLGIYGYPKATTPHLDRLAGASLLFTNAYSNAPWTLPSVPSLFTSTLPSVHRISKFTNSPEPQLAVLPPRFLLLPEIFRNHGYRTAMITTQGWISPESGYDQGLDEFTIVERRDAEVVSSAESFIARHANERFFLYVHFIDVHDYFHARHLFAPKPLPIGLSPGLLALEHATPREAYDALAGDLSKPGRLSATDRDFLIAAYDRQLAEADRLIGVLLEALKRADLLDRTCVVVTADHGEQFLEHGTLVHAGDALYNEVLHIPFILFTPRAAARGVVATPVSSIDIGPTLLDVMGIASPPAFQGRSALHADVDGRAVVAEGVQSLKLITSEWSYLYGAKDIREELYDLRADPGERHNLAAARAETSAALRARLLATMEASLRHDYVVSRPETATAPMSQALQERLRALGYHP